MILEANNQSINFLNFDTTFANKKLMLSLSGGTDSALFTGNLALSSDDGSDISISKNHVITHGIPSNEVLAQNDLLTIDIVSQYMGWYADMSWTFGVGNIDEESKFLIDAAWQVCVAGSGAEASEISFAVHFVLVDLDVVLSVIFIQLVGEVARTAHDHVL